MVLCAVLCADGWYANHPEQYKSKKRELLQDIVDFEERIVVAKRIGKLFEDAVCFYVVA